MRVTRLLPTKAVYRPGEPIVVEVRGLGQPTTLTVSHLGDACVSVAVDAAGQADFGCPPRAVTASRCMLTVGRCSPAPPSRWPRQAGTSLRYGFVADYRPGRDIAGFTDNVRRLHLTGVQVYARRSAGLTQ
jgi:dextranase